MAELTEDKLDLLDVRGRTNEVMQAFHSHEKFDEFRFKSMEEQIKDLRNAVDDRAREIKESATEVKVEVAHLREAMELGFANTDKKFWSLAITIIMLLLTVCGFLVAKTMVFHG